MRNTTLLFLCLITLLASCTQKEEPKPTSQTQSQTVQPSPTLAPTPGSVAPSTVSTIAVADGETPGLKAEIHELKRTGGDTLTLKFSIANGSAKALSFGYDFVEKGKDVPDFNTVGGVHLIDSAGKKKYFVVRDSEGFCSCSRDVDEIDPGSRSQLWAKFPAPPEDVQKISVVVPHFIPVEDVPISR
jgi:hypothetical protein